MPFPRTWLPNFPAICEDAQAFAGAEFDRDAVMHLFGLRRRAALLLMKEIGPQKVRGRWILPKAALLGWLADQAEDAGREIGRKARWSRAMLHADFEFPRKRSPLLTARLTAAEVRAVQEFPPGVTLTPGEPHRLDVEFGTIEELAEKILAVGVVIDKNMERYLELLESSSAGRKEREAEQADAAYFAQWRPR